MSTKSIIIDVIKSYMKYNEGMDDRWLAEIWVAEHMWGYGLIADSKTNKV